MPDWLDVSDTTPRIAYTAASGQTVFVVPFVFLDEEHLEVYQNGTLKTLGTHYTTSGEESETGGTITLVTGATASDTILIVRDVPFELTTHIPTSGQLDIAAINLQFSLLVMMMQAHETNHVRTLRQPDADIDTIADIPLQADRASKYLGFDADGDPTALSSVSTAAAATAFWVSVLSTGDDAAESRTLLGIADQSSYTGLSNWHHCR